MVEWSLQNDDNVSAHEDVNHISTAITYMKLHLSANKTKAMVVSRKRIPPCLDLVVEGFHIQAVSTITYLGFTISFDLTWGSHIGIIRSKAGKTIGFLHRTNSGASSQCLANLYLSVVRPVLEYGSAIWDPHQVRSITQLDRVKHSSARVFSKKWPRNATDLVTSLGWVPLLIRRKYIKLCVCKCIASGNSLIPASVFQPHPAPSVRHTNTQPFFHPSVRTHQQCASFFNSVSVISCSSHTGFKRHLKCHLVGLPVKHWLCITVPCNLNVLSIFVLVCHHVCVLCVYL